VFINKFIPVNDSRLRTLESNYYGYQFNTVVFK
jgi:hypothetical protein